MVSIFSIRYALSLLACILSKSNAFHTAIFQAPSSLVVVHAEGTGGWGLGNSREMVPEEFAKGSERRAFEGYDLTERGKFMRKVRQDAQEMRSNELDELLGVAKIAGIKVKDPSERLNKFEAELLNDEEDLDLSV